MWYPFSKVWSILRAMGIWYIKRWWLGLSVQSDIETLIALCDMDKPLNDTGEDIVYHQHERLEEINETEIAMHDTYDNLIPIN